MSWLQTQQPAFSTIALKTLCVFNSAHRPLLTYIQKVHLENGRGIDLVEAMENALPDFEEHSVVGKVLNHQGGGGVSHSLASWIWSYLPT